MNLSVVSSEREKEIISVEMCRKEFCKELKIKLCGMALSNYFSIVSD